MKQKHIGVIFIIVAFIVGSFVFVSQKKEEFYIQEIIKEQDTCFLEDGTCLHKQSLPFYIMGWGIAGTLLLFGIYLTFFDKTEKFMKEHQIKISEALGNAKIKEKEEERFNILLKGLSEDEKKIIKAVREQNGITQQTLRLRTDLHKSKLSIVLDGLEKKNLISRKVKGKTKQVFFKLGI